MAAVIRLVEYSNTETINALRALLVSAMAGQVIGIEAKVRILRGGEHTVRCGPYKQARTAVPSREGDS